MKSQIRDNYQWSPSKSNEQVGFVSVKAEFSLQSIVIQS